MSMNDQFREGAGFTLPEVLLAAVIITVAVLAVVGMYPTALQNVHYGGHMSQASSLAQEMVEMIRTQTFGIVSEYNSLDTRIPPGPLSPSVQDHFNRWQSDIAPADPSAGLPQGWGTIQVQDNALGLADLKQITITVGWQERGSQTITLVTYMAPHE